MEYVKFYGLDEEPFRNDPDRRFYFEGRAPSEARMRLLRGVQQCKGLSVLVGGPGRGKTTLARHLLDQLDGEERSVRLLAIPHAACDAGWLLPRIACAFGVAQPATTPMQLLGQIFERFATLAASGTHPVLLVDEAQMLRNREVMEEFRALLNLEHNGVKLLSLVLFGLPDLSEVLRLDEPLAQRVDIRVQLGAFDEDDTAEYIKHRLSCVGGAPTLFSDDAVVLLHECAQGIPRLINTLADNALFEGYVARAESVGVELVHASAEQLEMLPAAPQAEESSAPEPVAAGLQNPFAVTTAEPIEPTPPVPSTPQPVPAAPAPAPAPDMGWVQPQTATTPPPAQMVEPPTILSPPEPPAQPAVAEPVAPPSAVTSPAPPAPPAQPAVAEPVAPPSAVTSPAPPVVAAPPAGEPPRAPVGPAALERPTGAWESPIADDDTHGEMHFSDPGIEVELEHAIDDSNGQVQIEAEVELDTPHTPPGVIDILDEEEREETLSGLVEEMDEQWQGAVNGEGEAEKPQPIREAPPAPHQEADTDLDADSHSDLVDTLFDEITVED